MVREGTAARNLNDLLPLVTPTNSRRFFFVTDDRHPKELLEEGHIDAIVEEAIRLGLDPILAIQMATLNAAEYFRLDDLGAIAPGFRADIVAFDHLSRFRIRKVFKDGVLVAEDGKIISPSTSGPDWLFDARKRPLSGRASFEWRPSGKRTFSFEAITRWPRSFNSSRVRSLQEKSIKPCSFEEMESLIPISGQDILKIVVVERHRATGNIGIGFVQGFGLKRGAIGSSVAHDSHNLVIVGTNDEDILLAIHQAEGHGRRPGRR